MESPEYVTETKGVFGTSTKSEKVVTTVTDYFWKFDSKFELYAFKGNNPDEKVLSSNWLCFVSSRVFDEAICTHSCESGDAYAEEWKLRDFDELEEHAEAGVCNTPFSWFKHYLVVGSSQRGPEIRFPSKPLERRLPHSEKKQRRRECYFSFQIYLHLDESGKSPQTS